MNECQEVGPHDRPTGTGLQVDQEHGETEQAGSSQGKTD